MKSKKVVFFLLLMVILSALLTIWLNVDKTSLENPTNEAQIQALLGNYKTCILGAGLKLQVSATNTPNYFRLESTQELPPELRGKVQEGDVIINDGWVFSGKEIGQNKTLQVINAKTGLIDSISFKVRPFISCK